MSEWTDALATALKRAINPVVDHTRGTALPSGYSLVEAPAPRQVIRAPLVEAHRVLSLASLVALHGRTSPAITDREACAVVVSPTSVRIGLVSTSEPEAGEIVADIPTGLTFRALLSLTEWRPYGQLAELVVLPDLAIDPRDRACLSRLRAAKSIEVDADGAAGAVRATWAAKGGAENAPIPALLRCGVVIADAPHAWPLEISEPLVLRPKGDSIEARIHSSPESILALASEAVARAIAPSLPGVVVVAGRLDSSRWQL